MVVNDTPHHTASITYTQQGEKKKQPQAAVYVVFASKLGAFFVRCIRVSGSRACGKEKLEEEEENIPPTFILKLLFAFVQTVAFQTSLRSYGSRRSSWCC